MTLEIQVRDLPPFPGVIVDLLGAVDNERIGASGIAAMLRLEPTLAATVMRVANAAWYGRQPVSHLDAALARIGMARVGELITASWMSGLLPAVIPFYEESAEDLWRHSIATAVVAQQLAPRYDVSPQLAFLAGLLHDLGKVAIAINPGSDPQPLVIRPDERPVDAERRLLGTSHDEVVATLAVAWRLPVDLVEAMRWHHEPLRATTKARRMLATLVSFGSSVARFFGYGNDIGGLRRNLTADAYPQLGLSSDELQLVVLESLDPITALAQAFPPRATTARPRAS